jgi:indole-3-glycerol phosphate synthase
VLAAAGGAAVILDEIVAEKRRAHARREPIALAELWQRAAAMAPARPFAAALRDRARPAPRVIAEFKRRSPSAGAIRPGADPAAIARAYAAAGAAALSVLTDETFFDGALAHVAAARAAVSLPVLRKDFLLDERDLVETRLCGADAALLIVRLLERDELTALVACARRLGLATLVEAHSDAEIEVALAAGAEIVGVNHRDLDTLAIDLGLSARARARVGDAILVAESGIATPAHVTQMRAHGADAILVGEALMRSPDPGRALAELLA